MGNQAYRFQEINDQVEAGAAIMMPDVKKGLVVDLLAAKRTKLEAETIEVTFENSPDGVEEFVDCRTYNDTISHKMILDITRYNENRKFRDIDLKNPAMVEEISRAILQLNADWELLPDDLLRRKMVANTDTNTYDGTTFYSDTHPIDGVTGAYNDNIVTLAGATIGDLFTGIKDAMGRFASFKIGPDKMRFNNPDDLKFLILYPSAIETFMFRLFKRESNASEYDGALKDQAVIRQWGNLPSGALYIFVTNSIIKPFIHRLMDGGGERGWVDGGRIDPESMKATYGVIGRQSVHYWDYMLSVKIV